MIDFLVHLYSTARKPFLTLSTLPEAEAIAIMRSLYVKGSPVWDRFGEPEEYLKARKRVEAALLAGFVAKGGRPKTEYPVYFVLGRPRWVIDVVDEASVAASSEIVVPLSLFESTDISFTYPDSMVSELMVKEQNPDYYEPDYHGKIFTLEEIRGIVEKRGLPGDGWQTRMPRHLANYIEAQVWNPDILQDFLRRSDAPDPPSSRGA